MGYIDKMPPTPKWKQYQEDVAKVLRSVGMEAITDIAVEGARARHDVDVCGEISVSGLKLRWAVECKLQGRRVSKAHILTFREVVQDVGADVGLVLSESGFQAGAIAASRYTNVRLTSLGELRGALGDSIAIFELKTLRRRVLRCRQRYWNIDKDTRISNELRPEVASPYGYRANSVMRLVEEAVLGFLTETLDIRELDPMDEFRWQSLGIALDTSSAAALSLQLEPMVSDLERRLDEAEQGQ